jgi:hypothetical protein
MSARLNLASDNAAGQNAVRDVASAPLAKIRIHSKSVPSFSHTVDVIESLHSVLERPHPTRLSASSATACVIHVFIVMGYSLLLGPA